MNPNAPVTESIDQRILELLGLEETFDLDYATYTQALKERLLRVTAFGEKLPTEDFKLLKDELKRVKQKEKTKTFKIKPDKFVGKKKPETKAKITPKKLLLPSSGALFKVSEIENKSKIIQRLKPSEKEPIDILSRIDEKLSSILETLMSASKLQNKQLELDRKERENKKRQDKESRLEKRGKLVGAVVQKILKPFQNIFEKVWNFIKFTLLGRAFTMLMNWFADPKNKGKVETLGRFLKDWWPALLFAVAAFTNPFGGLVKGVIGTVVKWTFKIAKFAIPKLLSIIRKNPKAAASAALFTAGATIPAMFPGTVDEQERKTSTSPGSKDEKIRQLELQRANLNVLEKLQGKGSEIDEQLEYLKTGKTKEYGFDGGAHVSGEKGIDKIPAWLSDGEFVISRGAVNKFGVPFFETLNAAGGGTNKPKIINGATYAYGGGPIGNRRDSGRFKPNNDIQNIKQLLKRLTGYDVDKPRTWPKSNSNNNNRTPTGSLLTNPIGAIQRIIGRAGMGGNKPSSTQSYERNKSPDIGQTPTGSLLTDPIGAVQRMAGMGKGKGGGSNTPPSAPSGSESKPKAKGFMPGPVQEVIDKLQGSGGATFRNAGNLYAKQMLGGFGGPISERDLAPESQKELQKAIERAKKRTGTEIETIQAKIKKLKADGAENTVKGRQALANEMSFLKKLKAGGIRVKYQDYADEKGKMSESAENAKNILGQFWAYGRDKKDGGGYRIEDKYDFDMFKKKDAKTGKMRDMTGGELWNEGFLGKGKTLQQRLQALYLLNPLKGKGDVDMVLGGKRTAAENAGLAASKTLLGGLLGASGKPKDKNTQALEAKRPWWDKMGMFGGASAQMAREQQAKKDFEKKNPGATLYKKPQSAAKPTAAKPTTPKPYVGKARRRNSGGFLDISTNFGIDTSMFGPDTQYSPTLNAAFQPGEGLVDFDYVLTKDAMMNGAREHLASYAQNLNSSFDSNSNARKQGIVPKDISIPKITPYSQTSSSMTLPPIKSSSGGSGSMPTSPSSLPDFSVVPADGAPMRMANARLLGLVG